MGISKKIEKSISGASWIRKMFEEGERLRKIYGSENVFDFTLGNPENEPPAAFKEALKEIALKPVRGMHRYMNNAGYQETRQSVAKKLGEQTGLSFTADHIIMTCGAGAALNIVLKSILDPGDEVIILSPFFVEYKFYIDNHGGISIVAPTKKDFSLDIDAIRGAVTSRTKGIIINSPNNPTGVVYNEGSLKELGRMLADMENKLGSQIFVISDEPYAKIIYDDLALPRIFNCVKNSIVVTSHSKDLALPGERIGYAAVSPLMENAGLLMEALIFCNRIMGFVNAPALMQRLVAGLQHESVDIAGYREKRDILYEGLSALGFKMYKPQGAFYIFPESPLPDDVEFVMTAQKHNILLVPGSGFGAPGYFRIAYCVDKQVILNSLPAFKKLAAELGMKSQVRL